MNKMSVSSAILTCLSLTGCGAQSEFGVPTPQHANQKCFTATYLSTVKDKTPSQIYRYKIYSDGAGHIRIDREQSLNRFTLIDYGKQASYDVNMKDDTLAQTQLINPSMPSSFASPAIVDECTLSDHAKFIGTGKNHDYEGHHYSGSTSPIIHVDAWFSQALNTCTEYTIDSGIVKNRSDILVDYNSDKPNPQFFDLSKYREISGKEFYKRVPREQ